MMNPSTRIRSVLTGFAVILCACAPSIAQTQSQGGWRHVGDPPPATVPATPQAEDGTQNPATVPQQDPTEPVDRSDAYGQPQTAPPQEPVAPQTTAPATTMPQTTMPQTTMPQTTMPQTTMPQTTTPPAAMQPQSQPPRTRTAYGLPPTLTLQPGTFVTMRVNQMLSSDRNHVGDTFSGTLAQPVIVNGVVVAMRGQTVYGRVAEAEKAHAGKDSRLGLQLTGLTLADGTQMPLQSQLLTGQGPKTPRGIEAGTVAATTGVGAVIGGVVGWGTGAAIGAGAGAIAGLAGVLLTHNHATVIYPETALTFQVTSPVTVSTVNAPQAFRYVGPEDYQQSRPQFANRPPAGTYPRPAYGAPAPAYYYGPGYYYPGYYPYYSYYPYYWGPGVGVVIGGGWGRRGWRR